MKKEDDSISRLIIDLVKMIPPGRVTSYGAIANCLGTKRSARLVGWTLSHYADKESVPAHRVVNRNGLLSGRHHFSPPEKMQELLEQEGVQVKDNQVVNFQEVFWDPFDILQ
jgi:methylated-DNA-protein-cysteine methyltransferase-like protein